MNPRLFAIIVAAGASRRMGFDKLAADLAGRPVLAWSLDAFGACPEVAGIVLVAPASRVEEFQTIASGNKKLLSVVPGGAERPDSISAGLDALSGVPDGDYIALHDAARPLVAPETISRTFRAAVACGGGAAPAERVADTLHRTGAGGLVTETVSRADLWRVQTPQIFPARDLRALPRDPSRTDEISAHAKAGKPSAMVENPLPNFKITVPADLVIARALLASR